MVCTLPPPSLPWQVVTLTISHFPATPVSWDVFYRLKYRYKWQPEALDQRTLKLDSSAWWREQYQRNIAVAGIPSKVPSGGGGPEGQKCLRFLGADDADTFSSLESLALQIEHYVLMVSDADEIFNPTLLETFQQDRQRAYNYVNSLEAPGFVQLGMETRVCVPGSGAGGCSLPLLCLALKLTPL